MPTRVAVKTDKAPPPLPFFSQAIVCNGMVYCSGSIGVSPTTKALVEGGVGERTVSDGRMASINILVMTGADCFFVKAQALRNLSAVLEEAGSGLRKVVKVNVFLEDMTNFAAMNRVYDTFWEDPKPVSQRIQF